MGHRICLVSQKGGVGKTTVALNLAVALAESGRQTLLVDLDPQGGIGHALARQDAEAAGLVEVLMGERRPDEALVETKLSTLSLLPRGRLAAFDVPEYERAMASPSVLAGVLDEVDGSFERVIVDCPSGLGSITRAALESSHFALVPFLTEHLALRTAHQVLQVVDRVRAGANPRLQLLGLLPTMLETGNDDAVTVLSELWTGFATTFETAIPRGEVFAVASRKGLPVSFLGGRVSPEARRFAMLVAEVEERIAELTTGGDDADQRSERTLL